VEKMFPSRITTPLPTHPEQEDIFSSGLTTLFTDDVQISHGVPGSSVTYNSPRFGNIELRIPQHPDVEEGRKLFAHYLWNAGVICADAVEVASRDGGVVGDGENEGNVRGWNGKYWDMRGKDVLELGAGT
jgi:EEF1A N-terminal glycine/lysine methyltransferase